VQLVREGHPVDLILMRELHWTPAQIAAIPNRTAMELLAVFRLEEERKR